MDVGRTEIVNAAMLYANQDVILDPKGESINAKLCDMFYDSTLQEALSCHPWSFALEAAKLPKLAEPPRDFRFSNSYQLPHNFGRMHSVSSSLVINTWKENVIAQELFVELGDRANSIPTPEYIIQDKKLYTNFDDIRIVYVRTDLIPSEMTPAFRNFFAMLLASKLYVKMNGGSDGFADLQKRLAATKLEARNIDGEQADTTEPNRPNLLVAARLY